MRACNLVAAVVVVIVEHTHTHRTSRCIRTSRTLVDAVVRAWDMCGRNWLELVTTLLGLPSVCNYHFNRRGGTFLYDAFAT